MREIINYFQIPDADILFRIVLSIALGAGIGLERELTNKWAGLRTHMLVCLGSCLFTLLSIYGFSTVITTYPMGDPGRVAAQILTGIGFIGGGTVLRQGSTVYGLTTAATLWVVASIGMACGCGRFNWAIVSAILSVCVLVLIRIFEKDFMPKNHKNAKRLKISVICDESNTNNLTKKLNATFPTIYEFSKKKSDCDESQEKVSVKILSSEKDIMQSIHEKLDDIDYIHSVNIQEIYD